MCTLKSLSARGPAGVTHAISPISFKLSRFMRVTCSGPQLSRQNKKSRQTNFTHGKTKFTRGKTKLTHGKTKLTHGKTKLTHGKTKKTSWSAVVIYI